MTACERWAVLPVEPVDGLTFVSVDVGRNPVDRQRFGHDDGVPGLLVRSLNAAALAPPASRVGHTAA